MEGILETGYTMVKDLLLSYQRMKNIKFSKDALLRSYYFEVCTNLDVLDVIDIDKLQGQKVYSPAVFSILESLEIQIAALIVFSDDETVKELFKNLSKKSPVKETSEDNSEKVNNKKKSVLEAVLFTLQKITVLQKLSKLKSEKDEDILKNMRLKVRLNNIKEYLLFIKKQIEPFVKNKNLM